MMLGRKFQIATLMLAGLAMFVGSSGNADARYRCRQGLGWRQGGYTNGYSYNGGYSNGYAYATPVNTTSAPVMVNGSTVQPNGTYAVGKPVVEPAPAQPSPIDQAPAPVTAPQQINTVPVEQPINNRAFSAPNNNPSPDADNSARNLTNSGIPGTSPSKAPQPPAAAAAPQQ